MTSAGDLFGKLSQTWRKTPIKLRGRFFNGEIELSFIGTVAAFSPTSLDIAGEEWGLKIDLTDITPNEKRIDEGLPLELEVTFPSGAKMFLTELTN